MKDGLSDGVRGPVLKLSLFPVLVASWYFSFYFSYLIMSEFLLLATKKYKVTALNV